MYVIVNCLFSLTMINEAVMKNESIIAKADIMRLEVIDCSYKMMMI